MFTSRMRAAARYMLLVAAVMSNGALATDDATGAPSHDEQRASMSQVRLRKLHLVRPDLIPYPMAYDVYC